MMLKKLIDYLKEFESLGYNEKDIVKQYIKDNNLELEYSEMIIELTKSALNKEKTKFSKAYEMSLSIGLKHLETYTNEENEFIDRLTRSLAFDPDNTLEFYRSEILEKVPQMDMPSNCYIDVIALINHKFKIRFKDQDKDSLFINNIYHWEEKNEIE